MTALCGQLGNPDAALGRQLSRRLAPLGYLRVLPGVGEQDEPQGSGASGAANGPSNATT